jgi:dTMP kinase
MARKHPLICVEGIDGSGKNTHSKLLVAWLKTQGFPNAAYRDFPRYENVTGQAIRDHLKLKWQAAELERECLLARKSHYDDLVFQCLMTLNRYEETPDLLAALEHGPVVLDRYWASSYVYGSVDGLSATFIETISAQLPPPDISILLDIPVAESFLRRPERRDRYEVQKDFLNKARHQYLALFAARHWKVVDAYGTQEEVQARVRDCIPTSLFM